MQRESEFFNKDKTEDQETPEEGDIKRGEEHIEKEIYDNEKGDKNEDQVTTEVVGEKWGKKRRS